ncbi:L-fuco-beta-pyranose dehydrogenase (EC [Olavius sp. associated proteobacterium Delta 1]|nr:L-fuco-beta-pyranose dehydrogenase (EC [Olavius sp. associated proteobacterium Delta 1]
MIEKIPFGKTGHKSSRTIFGSVSLGGVTQSEADRALDLLWEFGVNHIDTAPKYGEAELRLGSWMKKYRNQFFLATKTNERTYQDAKDQFYQSLDRLQVDSVDLLQFHNLTDVVEREIIMGPGGALEFLIEAREKGLTRYIGITGHGLDTPRFHMQTLERFAFDSVLLPCNYLLMQDANYTAEFEKLLASCREHQIAVQTIKSIARGYWGDKKWSHSTWYEPLTNEKAITKCVHWVLSIPDIFLNTVGDLQELPKVLKAATSFEQRPSDEKMSKLVEERQMQMLFN